MVEHTIDLQSLEIKQQSPNYSYIGLDENNELVRTTIDSSSAFSNLTERAVYLTSSSAVGDFWGDVEEGVYEITDEQRAYNIETYNLGISENPPLLIYQGFLLDLASVGYNPENGTGMLSFTKIVGETTLLDTIGVISIYVNQYGDADAYFGVYNFYSKDEVQEELAKYTTKSEFVYKIEDVQSKMALKSDVSALTSDVNTIKEDVNENAANIGVVSGDVENLKIDNYRTQYVNITMYSGNETVGYSIKDGWYGGSLKYNLATINGQTLLQNKNIEIDLSNYYTKAEVDSMLAEINERLKGLN